MTKIDYSAMQKIAMKYEEERSSFISQVTFMLNDSRKAGFAFDFDSVFDSYSMTEADLKMRSMNAAELLLRMSKVTSCDENTETIAFSSSDIDYLIQLSSVLRNDANVLISTACKSRSRRERVEETKQHPGECLSIQYKKGKVSTDLRRICDLTLLLICRGITWPFITLLSSEAAQTYSLRKDGWYVAGRSSTMPK